MFWKKLEYCVREWKVPVGDVDESKHEKRGLASPKNRRQVFSVLANRSECADASTKWPIGTILNDGGNTLA